MSKDANGKEKVIKENYLLLERMSFADAEEDLYQFASNKYGLSMQDLDVTHLKRSKIMEVANIRESDADKIFVAVLVDVFTDDNGVEKETKYQVLCHAKDISGAHNFFAEFVRQGYNMTVKEIKETKFVEVISSIC